MVSRFWDIIYGYEALNLFRRADAPSTRRFECPRPLHVSLENADTVIEGGHPSQILAIGYLGCQPDRHSSFTWL